MYIQFADNMATKFAGGVVEGWVHVYLQQELWHHEGLTLSLKGNERTFIRKKHQKWVKKKVTDPNGHERTT